MKKIMNIREKQIEMRMTKRKKMRMNEQNITRMNDQMKMIYEELHDWIDSCSIHLLKQC